MNAASRPLRVADILSDPRWFLAGLDGARGLFNFVCVDHAALARAPFLDRRWDVSSLPRCDIAIAELFAAVPMAPPRTPMNFIWHTGFCCSTLIVRLLDRPGYNLSLGEPMAFTALADARRAGAFPDRDTESRFLQVVLHLLGRPMEKNSAVTVKPAPAASCYVGRAAALTSGKALLLHSDCRSFVISAMTRGENYVQRMFQAFAIDGLNPDGVTEMSALQAAALVWRMQMQSYRNAPPAASLDCDAFLAAPQAGLEALDAFFALGLGAKHIALVLDGPLFRSNAKRDAESFDAQRRREAHAAAAAAIGPELDHAVAWSAQFFPETSLPNPLMEPVS